MQGNILFLLLRNVLLLIEMEIQGVHANAIRTLVILFLIPNEIIHVLTKQQNCN